MISHFLYAMHIQLLIRIWAGLTKKSRRAARNIVRPKGRNTKRKRIGLLQCYVRMFRQFDTLCRADLCTARTARKINCRPFLFNWTWARQQDKIPRTTTIAPNGNETSFVCCTCCYCWNSFDKIRESGSIKRRRNFSAHYKQWKIAMIGVVGVQVHSTHGRYVNVWFRDWLKTKRNLELMMKHNATKNKQKRVESKAQLVFSYQ